jgi:hypothetical protein
VNFTYSLFGLRIQSNLAIPRLIPVAISTEHPDVEINLGSLPVIHSQSQIEPKNLVYASSDADKSGAPAVRVWKVTNGDALHLVYFDGVQFWLDRTGANIWALWPETSSLENVATYLVGPILGLLLRLRGITCLHASAVASGDRAVAFVGSEGAGKSTTAAALARRGYPVLSDDVVTLVERGGAFHVMPAYPYLCLWPDSVEKIEGSREAFSRFTPEWDKRCLPLGSPDARFEDRALPLGAIYVFGDQGADPALPIKALSAQDAFITLVANTFATNLLDSAMRAAEFAVLARLVSTVPIRRLHRSKTTLRLDQLCQLIGDDLHREVPDQSRTQPA